MRTKPQRIYSSLKAEIQSGKFPAGSRLPSLSQLGESLSASKGSILNAFSQLEEEGLIKRQEKVGVFVRGTSGKEIESFAWPSVRQSKAEQLAQDIKTEICQGVYRVGDFLPIAKVIQYRYRCSPPTVRRAMQLLQKTRLLNRKGKVFVIGQAESGSRASERKALLVADRIPSKSVTLGERNVRGKFTLSTVTNLNKLGWLTKRGDPVDQNNPALPGTPELRKVNGVISMVAEHITHSFEGEHFGLFEAFLKKADRLSLPFVAYRDSPYSSGFLRAVKKYRQFYPIASESSPPGKRVGEHMALFGHKNIAFFSFTWETWDEQRYEEARKSHRAVFGSQSGFELFPANHNSREFLKRYSAKEKGTHFARFVEKEHNGYVFQVALGNNPYWEGKNFVRDLLWRDRLYQVMPPLFDRALRNDEFTAWICADPVVALAAAEFLRSKGKRVPGDLSLASIDDRDDLVMQGITAFNYRPEQLGYLAAHCIAGDIPVKRKRNGLVDCPGRIIERGSVARVQKAIAPSK